MKWKYLDVRKIKRLKTQFLSFYPSMKTINEKYEEYTNKK